MALSIATAISDAHELPIPLAHALTSAVLAIRFLDVLHAHSALSLADKECLAATVSDLVSLHASSVACSDETVIRAARDIDRKLASFLTKSKEETN